jgi:hypothetical protein
VPPAASKSQRAPFLGALAFFLTIVVVYAGLRAHDVLFKSEANPATVLYMYDDRIAMFWRTLVGVFAGGPVALVVILFARRAPDRVARALDVMLPIVVVLATLQAVLLP